MCITMSQKELSRLEIVNKVKVIDKRLTQSQAAKHLNLSRRQICRLIDVYKKRGAKGLASKKREQPSNRRYPEYFREYVLEIIRTNYADFGPTLTCEKLLEVHEIGLCVETVRNWMLIEGIWTSRRQHNQRVYQPRNRRDSLGELVQIDGSDHWWFEDRGPRCTLLVYIDKHATFGVNKTGATSGSGMTQFGWALHELNIDIICANTSQAKGRVERANKTLQGRLVKEMRLLSISTMEVANAYLPQFIDQFNQKFAKPARMDNDSHRPFIDFDDLDCAMSWQETRTVSQSLTIQCDKVLFLLEPIEFVAGLKRKTVTVHDYPDGRLEIRFEGKGLPYPHFDKISQVKQGETTSNKRLGAVFGQIKEQQINRTQRRSKRAPKLRGQTNTQFATA